VAHIYSIGCRTYARNRILKTANKTESRALIGHLIGYQGTNIFHIWLPTKEDIFVTQDVIFDPEKYYMREEHYTFESIIEEVIKLLEYPLTPEDNDIELKELLTRWQRQNYDSTPATQDANSQVGGESSSIHEKWFEHQPEHRDKERELDLLKVSMPDIRKVPEGYRAYGEITLRDVNLNVDTSNIITGKRQHTTHNLDTFTVNFQTTNIGITNVTDYLCAFSTEISKPPEGMEVPHIHQN
jgi:hypothetical protein